MKDGRLAQAGKYNEILDSGEEFMELVGAHKDALTALDAIDAANVASPSSGTEKLSKSPSSVEKKDEKMKGTHKVDSWCRKKKGRKAGWVFGSTGSTSP